MHPIEVNLQSIVSQFKKTSTPAHIKNRLKEYLQDVILSIIYNDPTLKQLTFYGGSCLRKIFGLNRLSEDLDFETNSEIPLKVVEKKLSEWFRIQQFDSVSISTQTGERVSQILVKFEILNRLGLSMHTSEKLHVKIEINPNPKAEYHTLNTPHGLDQYFSVIKHYDLPTLMAGKMAACIKRTFLKGNTGVTIKGRDYYDLLWYMQREIIPNETALKNSLSTKIKTTQEAFAAIDSKVEKIKTRDLIVDLEPLFSDNAFVLNWSKNFHIAYLGYRAKYQEILTQNQVLEYTPSNEAWTIHFRDNKLMVSSIVLQATDFELFFPPKNIPKATNKLVFENSKSETAYKTLAESKKTRLNYILSIYNGSKDVALTRDTVIPYIINPGI